MRLKRPRPASPDQVRITREGETAVIEYADPSIRVVNLRVGPSLAALTEIPPGLPQIEYNERSNQWVPRGRVLRCHIEGRTAAAVLSETDTAWPGSSGSRAASMGTPGLSWMPFRRP